ncbi:hypothetical protein SpCBS45565_g04830 [Spizellomyces sp. 'palustris']|nr:hypothetical protein SpCBS45565_g04830 [Spizellomyces sp. 'palustris']
MSSSYQSLEISSREASSAALLNVQQDDDDSTRPATPLVSSVPSKWRIPSTVRIVLLSSCAALGGFLGGYDTGIISGATLYIQDEFSLSNFETELIVSGVIAGAVAGGLAAGKMTDIWGRKYVIVGASIVFVVGAIIMSVAGGWGLLLVGRLIAGAAVGSGAAVPVYIAELSPPAIRGMLVNFNAFFIALGQLVSYLVAYALSDSPDDPHSSGNWRLMLGLAAVPAVIQCFGMSLMPMSPRYLVQKGRTREAYDVLASVRPSKTTSEELESEVESIKQSLSHVVDEVPFKEMLVNPEYRAALAIAVGLQVLQQFSGINTIMYYSATILRMAGFPSKSSAILFSTFIALANCFGSLTAMRLIDRTGRRWLLLTTLVGVAAGLIILSTTFHVLSSGAVEGTVLATGDRVGQVSGVSWIALLSLVLYVFFYAIGLGCVPWIIISEIFPLEIRGKGAGVAIAANWFTNFVISITFLTITHLITPAGTFLIYAGAVIIGWVFVYIRVPETKGRCLEDIGGGSIVFAAH